MSRSPQLSRAMVNRLWSHFFSYGFTQPVDDMGSHVRPSHPELLEQLAADFAGAGYDVKRLIRWIVLSEPYSLSSRVPKDTVDDPVAGRPPLFSYFYVRQMRAEELYESLLALSGGRDGSYEECEEEKTVWMQQFMMAYDTEENDEASTFNGTITQTLAMFNGELVRRATEAQPGSVLAEVASTGLTPSAKVQRLFTAGLSRRPSPAELRMADQVWQSHAGDAGAALADIWWAILNSNEFILNH
jgi:hypothetical protein